MALVDVILLKPDPLHQRSSHQIKVIPDVVFVHSGPPASPDQVAWACHSTDPEYDTVEIEFPSSEKFFADGTSSVAVAPISASKPHPTIVGVTPRPPEDGTTELKYTVRFKKTGLPTIELDPDIIRCRP